MLLTSVKLSAHNETSTAAHNHYVHQNRFQKIRAAGATSLSLSAENIFLSKRAPSRHRLGRPADVRKQIASRNWLLLPRHLARRRVFLEDRYLQVSIMHRDLLRLSRRAVQLRADSSRDSRARISAVRSRNFQRGAARKETYEQRDGRSCAGRRIARATLSKFAGYARLASSKNR